MKETCNMLRCVFFTLCHWKYQNYVRGMQNDFQKVSDQCHHPLTCFFGSVIPGTVLNCISGWYSTKRLVLPTWKMIRDKKHDWSRKGWRNCLKFFGVKAKRETWILKHTEFGKEVEGETSSHWLWSGQNWKS